MNNLTPMQLAAVQGFAAHYGPQWKRRLRNFWEHGWGCQFTSTRFCAAELQSLRNTLGPRWLAAYKLPTEAK